MPGLHPGRVSLVTHLCHAPRTPDMRGRVSVPGMRGTCQRGHVSLSRPRATLPRHAPVTARTLRRDRRHRAQRHRRCSYHDMYAEQELVRQPSLRECKGGSGIWTVPVNASPARPPPLSGEQLVGEGRLRRWSDDYRALGAIWARSGLERCHGNKSVPWHPCPGLPRPRTARKRCDQVNGSFGCFAEHLRPVGSECMRQFR